MRRGLLGPLIKLVAFLIITSFFTLMLASTISNKVSGKEVSYKAQFTDVTGLNVGDDVRVAGVRVGTVTGIKNVPGDNNNWLAEVKFSVLETRPLPQSSQVRIRWRNLVGTRILTIEPGAGDANAMLKKNDVIPVTQTEPAVDLTVLFNGFSPLLQSLDAGQINALADSLIKTLQGEAGSLRTLMTQVGELTNALADKDAVIGSVVDNLNGVLQTLSDHDTQVADLIDSLQVFMSGLAADRTAIGDGIESVNALADVTANLLRDVRPDLKTDVVELTRLLKVLTDNSDAVEDVLQRAAPKYAALIRTASYGSWFNFYLCEATGTLRLPGLPPLPIHFSENTAPRCQG